MIDHIQNVAVHDNFTAQHHVTVLSLQIELPIPVTKFQLAN